MVIPKKQICAWVERPGPDANIDIREVDVGEPGEGEVLIKLEVSGVCHSDHHSIYGNTPMSTHIAGHEGVGSVIKGMDWLHRACGKCETCALDYTHCPSQDNSGRNISGTFQPDAAYITRIPGDIPAEVAAPILCGGITVYKALLNADLKAGDFVGFPGAGGGLGHLGLQIAASMGFRVIAIDSADKESTCANSGAEHFLDFRKSANLVQDVRTITGGVGAHAVLCITGAQSAYDNAIAMLRNCGRLVCIGIPPTSYRLQVNPFEMLVRGLKIIGSSVGSKEQMQDLMQLAAAGKVKPEVHMYELHEVADVLDKLHLGQVSGRAVLRIPE
ncbi:NAD(P)-binding protein [Thozetella sp. PMI_491]|nr:NAD(P)-binding protein [Thozetella sp. PMI_491]